MKTTGILMFVAVTIVIGSIASMTTSDVFASQTVNPSNSNTNTATNESDSTASTSTNDNFAGVPEPPAFDPRNFSNEETIGNPYLTFTPGTTFKYESETEEGTEEDVVTVYNETKEILGVTARVVQDTVYLDGELIEDTFDWYAQDKEGTVWYMGEDSKEYDNGEVVSTEGSWEAGVDGAQPGIIMEADPQVGDSYRQEYYPGHAEDAAKVVSLSEEVTVPFGTFTNCLQTRDVNLLDPAENEDKYYCTNVSGVTLEVAVDSGERTELIDFNQSNGAESISANDIGATDDVDEPGDNDVNDEEDQDTGNEDAGEIEDDD